MTVSYTKITTIPAPVHERKSSHTPLLVSNHARFLFALILDCAACSHSVCETVAVSKSVAVIVVLLPWKLTSVISEKKQVGGCENTPSAISFNSCVSDVMVYGVVS